MSPSPELLGRLDPASSSYLQAVRERVLIFDGAMGTNLQLLGLSAEDFGGPELEGCNEILISSRPDLISQVHRSFYEVGCDVVETGTFGSSPVVLAEYGLADRAREISRHGAELATEVAAEFATPARPRWVAGSMGPGTKFPTLGQIPYVELRGAYEEQALGLLEGGVDLLLIETVFDLLSAKAAINGARRAMAELDRIVPLQVQVTIELTGRMLPGTEIAAALTVLDAMQVDVVGLNCATGPVEMSEALRHLSSASRVPIACIPNAGLPSVVDGKMHYDLTPEELAEHLHRFVTEFGVSIVGGCCGTTPSHLAAVVERCANAVAATRSPVFEPAAASIYTAVPFHQDTSFLVVGERTNANGSKRFREAMLQTDWDTCVAMARDQVTEGSHLIDVCVDYTGADGVADMTEVASRFATQASVPLMVDSTEGPVVRAALQWIGGRPVLNSVNLEEGDGPGTRLDTFLRLAREFGAAVVCTCIDEEGQARTAEWKLRAARNIRDIAVERYGLEPEDLLFDPLALPLSTGMEESRLDGIETIEGIRAIKAQLPGVSTILGLSNVSFGLNPAARQVLNSVFLHECVEAGLDSAIVHASKILPLSRIDERAKEISLDLIYNRRSDDYDPLQELLALFDGVKVNTGAQEEHLDWPVERRLSQRIIDGNRTGLDGDLNEALDSGLEALAIVNDVLLEGMKVVGDRFASGEMQLPFVLQSAETMKAAVAFLEPHMEKADQGGKGTVVLATVKGDVHDIGKNLVDIILTNNGYEVINLGIKIGINEMIVAAEEHKADVIGMSGLLVKSTLIMRENLVELNQRDLADYPILLGGAALTRTYVERDLREIYDGRLFYGRDAFEGLRTMDRLVEMKRTGQDDPEFGRQISQKNVPKRSRLEPQDAGPVEGQPARADVAADNRLFRPPFVGTRVAKGIPIDDIAEFLNLTALFRNQWQFRPENGEDDTEFKTRVRAVLRQELAKAREADLLIPQVAYGHFAANAEGNDLVIWKDEARTSEWMRFAFPRQRKEPWLCIADFFRSTDSGDEDFASFMLCTIGPRASEEAARLFAENQYRNYMFLHGLSVEMAEATAEYWHKRIREELGFADEDGPTLTGLFRQQYRGGRYSWGYPACPDLEENAKVVELLGGDRIGVTVSEGFQLHPEQTTDAIICHHPEAKYFVGVNDGVAGVAGAMARVGVLLLSVVSVLSLVAGPASAKSPPTLRSLVLSAPGPGYVVVSEGPLDAGTIATSSPNPSVAAAALHQLSKSGSVTTYERVWRNSDGDNEVQDLVIHFSAVPAAAAFFSTVAHALSSAEVMSSTALQTPRGAYRTTYFASTATQVGVGEAISMRSGTYVATLSFFSSNAATNTQPISEGEAQFVAAVQYASLARAEPHPLKVKRAAHSSHTVAWVGVGIAVVLGIALMLWVLRSTGPQDAVSPLASSSGPDVPSPAPSPDLEPEPMTREQDPDPDQEPLVPVVDPPTYDVGPPSPAEPPRSSAVSTVVTPEGRGRTGRLALPATATAVAAFVLIRRFRRGSRR